MHGCNVESLCNYVILHKDCYVTQTYQTSPKVNIKSVITRCDLTLHLIYYLNEIYTAPGNICIFISNKLSLCNTSECNPIDNTQHL